MKPLNVIKDENDKVVSFDIDREFWFRGNPVRPNKHSSSLLDSDEGTLCCLGFYSLACGYKREEILNVSWPSELPRNHPMQDKIEWLINPEDDFGDMPEHIIGNINDNTKLSGEEREQAIKNSFANQGITVNFV